jgi:ATP phosphoribosyltransferase regulatory subunit
MRLIPDGTRFTLPPEWEWRETLRSKLEAVLSSWGYEAVQTPSLEVYDPYHPQADKSFKLVDRDGTVLALRGEYTTAISSLVRANFPDGPFPLRLRYAGQLWTRARDAELGRQREFTQVGAELLGVSTPLADAEVVTLALECLEAVGFSSVAVELGHPGFVRAVLSETKLEPEGIEKLRTFIHRKNAPELAAELQNHGITGKTRDSVMALIDLYGTQDVLIEAEQYALNDAAKLALAELQAVAEQLPQKSVLFDVGIARRLDYYSGMIFQAYTPDFGQPLVGGGRYDGTSQQLSSLPACGFALGLERIMTALGGLEPIKPPHAIADSSAATKLRAKGWRVENAFTLEVSELEAYALKRGILYLATDDQLLNLNTRESQNLNAVLENL